MESKPCILDTRQTFGKDKKNKKFLYRCFPDDRSSPILVPFEIPPQFQKKRLSYYVIVEYTLPVGKMLDNLGDVTEPEHYYEYLLHCKKLNVSHRHFQNEVLRSLSCAVWDLPFRDARVFTIDGPTSMDFDDGLSVDSEKVSVYITHVPYVLEKLNLWSNLTSRISSIYFPNKRYPLLPGLLSTLCSLNENTIRPCLALDLYHDGRIEWVPCTVKIHKNYTYSNVTGQDYASLLARSGTSDSESMVHHYMTRYNTVAGSVLQGGIYLQVHAPVSLPPDWLPAYSRHYSTYEHQGTYAQLTSPIRRLVDILNMTQLTRQLGYSYDYDIMSLWYNKLDTINLSFRAIRKAQTTAKLLDLFDRNAHQVFEGVVWDDHVYLREIGVMMRLPDHAPGTYLFRLYVFHDEAFLTRKVRLQIETPESVNPS